MYTVDKINEYLNILKNLRLEKEKTFFRKNFTLK